MPYDQFTIRKVRQDFNLTIHEGGRFLPQLPEIEPSPMLQAFLTESLPLAIATGSEKARSEAIIYPILLEIRTRLDRQISLFSGEEFTVDLEAGLSGTCDFLLSRSPGQLDIEAPVVIITEAKKADLKSGMGQCIAEMVAAQRFNQANQQAIATIYGCVSNGEQWRFLKLENQAVTVDLTDYPLPPIAPILTMLHWIAKAG
jgi:hypothetical protein